MPKNSIASIKSSTKSRTSYKCRICKYPHPLRTCRKFLAMNVTERIRAVRKHRYCKNCLAHYHSHGTCFSKRGCKHCERRHHTLLHIHPKLLKEFLPPSSSSSSSSRSPSPKVPASAKKRPHFETNSKESSPPTGSKKTSLTSILRQSTIVLLPTVLVKIDSTTSHARCLLDSGSLVSRVSKKLVDKFDMTAYTLHDETICPLVLKSRFDSTSKIEGTFRVDNRITLRTPTQSLPESYKKNFRDLFLADSKFYESDSIDVIIGADLYPKVLRQGDFSRVGFPTAQSTIFGWTIYGPCSI